MSGKIAVIGSNMVDLITYMDRMPEAGETLEAPNFQIGHGGKGANQAIAAARLGAKVVMVTKVGDDLFADNTIKNFENHGIDTRFVKKVAGKSSGVAPIFVDPTGENRILIIKGANADLCPQDIDEAAEELKTCSLILLQLEVSLETIYYAIEFGAKHGIKTILNPAPADPRLDIERIRKVTFFTPNESELALLTGLPVETQEDVEKAARTLIQKGIETVVVTMGSRGALLITAETSELIPSSKVKAVDTTGAGDAFIGSFARFYSTSNDVSASLKTAALYAADSITKRGTQTSYATPAEFEEFRKSLG
ncbi:ribokinase [Microvirga sp. W0021]|uniref:Deoxyribokinase n=1 Tax=Hohaiivirga grylli TaxID=3133970 RepID=A0ABV0BFX0_9HYPH